MNTFATLSPIQNDIFLDEIAGTKQHYGIGLLCQLPFVVEPTVILNAIKGLDSDVKVLSERIWQAAEKNFTGSAIVLSEKEVTEENVTAVADAVVAAEFSLSEELLRVTLLKTENHHTYLVVSAHHILFDGEAIVSFTNQLVQRIEALGLNKKMLAGRNLAQTVNDCLQGFDTPETVQYWSAIRKQLQPLTDESLADQAGSVELVSQHFNLPAETAQLCRDLRITEPFLLKAITGLVIAELYNAEGEVLIDEVINHRSSRDRGTLGSFSGFIPFVTPAVDTKSTFRQWLSLARQSQKDRKGKERISQFQCAQLGLIGQGLRVIFNFHGYSQQLFANNQIQLLKTYTSENPSAIQIYFYYDAQQSLRILCSHPKGPQQAVDIIKRIQIACQSIIANPAIELSDITLLDDRDVAKLGEWNDTDFPFEECLSITQLFDRQVTLAPKNLAVLDAHQSLTFEQLQLKANRLACYLCDNGVAAGDYVGVCVDRSVNMIIAVLAIIKTGAAYVPLEPDYPDERLLYIVENSGIGKVLCDNSNETKVASWNDITDIQHLNLDALAMRTVLQEGHVNLNDLEQRQNARHVAYVIYTSGSTGKPKGVMLEHRGVVNRLAWMQRYFQLSQEDTILQKTPFGFDVSVWELFWGLLCGAKTAYLQPEGHKDPAILAEAIQQYGVTTLHFVPSMLDLFVHQRSQVDLQGVKFVICSGEALPVNVYHDARQVFAEADVVNLYGPTEASIDVTVWRGDKTTQYSAIPIGQPIDNTTCHILNCRQKQLPIGYAGELYLGGVQLARGYLGRPELTAEKFLPDPFRDDPEARLYRTGDLVRYDAEGAIHYLGRMDDQVKIRGFRIELGEIEERITQLPGVRSAVVVAEDDGHGQKHLLAYATKTDDAGEDSQLVSAIRAQLQATLPGYMVPVGYQILSHIPLSPNGKIDRKALPKIDLLTVADAAYEAPATATEAELAKLWSELLGIDAERIGRQAHFFELGGHSLLVVRLLSEIRQTLQRELSIREVFEYPQLSQLAARLEQAHEQTRQPGLIRQPRSAESDSVFPASFAQKRLWLLDQLDEGNAHYNLPAVLHIQGTFDPVLAERVLQTLVDRHESLRTVFTMEDNEVQQCVRRHVVVSLPVHDWCHVAEHDQQQRLQEQIDLDARSPFNLAQDLMVRASYYQTSEANGWLLFNLHHIATDGWSMGILMTEFVTLYDAFAQQQPNPLPALAFNYADYAVWQRSWLQDHALDAQLHYWQTQLASLPQVHSLPLDYERPKTQTFSGAEHRFTVSGTLASQVKGYAQQEQATVFMVLHSAFTALLSRYSQQPDIVMATPVANRQDKNLEALVGFFVNSLVLRVDCQPQMSFQSLLAHVKQVNIDAQSHQDVPFELLVETLNPERSVQHAPLCQIMFSMDPQSLTLDSTGGVQFERVWQPSAFAKYELLLNVVETTDGLSFTFEYNRDLFNAQSIERMGASFVTLLGHLLETPDQAIASLPLLPESAQQALHALAQGPHQDLPSTAYVHQRIEQQAVQTPEATAVVFGEQHLTYAQLNAQANQLARQLQHQGIQANDLVGLCMRPSLELVVSLLATVKAQAAYVPIDPDYPVERMTYMLNDSQVALVLTDTRVVTDHLEAAQRPYLTVTLNGFAQHADTNLNAPGLSADQQRLYVIYTSGSTGQPKAAQVVHQGALNLLQWYIERVDDPEQDRVLLLSSLSFDLTQKNIWSPLMMGGTLVLNHHRHYDAEPLLDLIEQQRITRLNCAPSAFYPLLDAHNAHARLTSLRQVYLGGESIRMGRIRAWLRQSRCELINSYGPTECTDVVSFAVVHADDPAPAIGRPIPNTQLYVLNEHQQMQPQGSTGELCVGGTGVGLGYLGRPELTAEKFLPDPFRDDPEARLYRTGDLVRYDAEGAIHYLGRMDDQVKIRGFRIELGEIEERITQLPGVRSAVVVAEDDGHGQKHLLAYATKTDDAGEDSQLVSAIRAQLQATLPGYMVPVGYQILSHIPLSPNGKIDRKALPKIDLLAVADAAYEAPATATEAELAKLWSELLGIDAERIGRQAHFFELGGHSLLVVRMIAGIKKAFSKEVSVTDVFSTPLLGTLADAIDRKTNTELAGDHYPITPRSNPDSTQPLTETQKRIWLQCQLNPNDTSFNIFGCYSLQGELDKDRLERALQVVVREHEVLRTRIVSGPQPQQYFDPTLSVSIHHGSIIGLDDDAGRKAIERWKKAEADVHFDLANGPLLRLGCVELTQTSFLLTVNVHHLIADAWTLKLLVDALLKCYEGRSTNEATQVSPIQFGDYATWLTHRANEDNHQSLKSYWRSQLSAPIEPLQIPGCQLSKVTEVTGREVVHTFSPDVTQQLKALATRFDASPYMVLLSVLNVLLFRLSSQSDQIIGMPVSGRDHPQTHDLMGCFVNVLPIRVENIASDTFDDLLKKVRKVCLSAFDHQTLPFEHIVEVANFKRAVGRSPLFDVLLNWFEQVEAQIVIDGLTLQEDSAPVAVAKYPLTIYAHESEGCWRMRWHYQPERLNDKVIEILLNQFSVLVEQLVSRSNQKISELSLVIEGGEMPRWTAADESSVTTPYLPEVFNHGLTRFNDNIAVRQGNHQYNYAQLLENADSIVELLKQQAVTPGQVVAVSGYRSFGLVSAMVAVVKSGGVLLMIDSQSSPTRQRQIIDQATPAALLWISDEPTPSVAEYIPKTITINPTACCTASEPGLREVPNVSADTLAYIFFTSGSTGLPKGVLGNHGGLSHFVHWQKHKYGLGERDKSAQLTGLGFDVLMRDVFTPLISGATVCIPETTLDMSATAVFSWMRKEQVTMLHTVPSIMKYWLQDTQADLSLPEEMRIFFAGEPLTTELVERVLQRCGRVNISNFYGPTESTLAKFHFDWYEGGSQMPVVPVGQPISDAGYEVVNEYGQHCGFLEPGEVVIHTVHCSSGYLGSGLTGNFRRITGSCDGLVAYKTGDLGFVSEQGVLQLAGRKDDQVKIRGVRIDLAEVQQAILACHGISNGFVTSFTDDQNDKHIVAYVEFVGGHDDVGELRKFLSSHLDVSFRPKLIIPVKKIPLNANGKVDRKALPNPKTFTPNHLQVLNARPNGEIESRLFDIWTELLGHSDFAMDNNFFEVGGHSLQILEVRARIMQTYNVDLSLVDMFEAPTINDLVSCIQREKDHLNNPTPRTEDSTDRASIRRATLRNRRSRQPEIAGDDI